VDWYCPAALPGAGSGSDQTSIISQIKKEPLVEAPS